MNRHVNAIAGRLSLRPPQRESLEILDRVTEIAPPRKDVDVDAALAVIHSEFPSVTNFERDFPSLCFALATGVGKTRLMGAFISYLHLAHGINNFFVLAPNLTIYNKLRDDFTPNTPKYVFKGIAEFATEAPAIINGDNYEAMASSLFDATLRCKINIFNISKINSEVRGGKSPRIKRLSEYIGESYFEYLAGLPDLVLLMDESHRYRASAGVRAINELKPVLGLELTATPFVESPRGPVPFKNVILDYPLGRAMADGFVKEPAVVTRKDFNPAGMSTDEIERMKLEDAVRLHESVKVQLETYAREYSREIVKPFVLVIARNTTHAKQLLDLIESEQFFAGNYKGKVIQVDSSRTGAEEEEMIARLLKVEHTDEPTEIVIVPIFAKPEEQRAAQIAYTVIKSLENQPQRAPSLAALSKPAIQAEIVKAVQEQFRPEQLELEGVTEQPNFAAVVAKTAELVQQQTITIPRILVIPTGVVKSGFKPFDLKLETLRYPVPSEELWSQYLRTGKRQLLSVGVGGVEKKRLEDYIVSGLVDFDDISYDDHADLLYNFATQTVEHFESYLSEGETAKVLRYHQREIARFIHSQMQEHFWEEIPNRRCRIRKRQGKISRYLQRVVCDQSGCREHDSGGGHP